MTIWKKRPATPEPVAEVHEITVEQDDDGRPRLVSVEDVGSWMTASEEREMIVFVQIEAVLDGLAERWPRRVKMFRRELAWVRRAAADMGLEWGRHVHAVE